jgi:outer membrane protein TolC
MRLAQAEQARLSLQHTLASQKEQLNQLLGRDVRTPFALVPVPDLPVADSDLDAAISRAKADRPEVREARLRVEQADLDRRIAESQKIPDISLSAVYVTLANVDFLPRNLASVGLQLSWEPFDWGRKSREAAQKGRTVQQARLALADTEDRVALDVLAATRRLEDRRSDLRVAALTQDAAAERLRERSEQAKVDAALFADLLQARSQLADASARHQQAIAAYWNARADAERALGVDRR